MSINSLLTNAATTFQAREAAAEAARLDSVDSMKAIEAKLKAFAEVVHNTHRKMEHADGFMWAWSINRHPITVLKVTATTVKIETRITTRKGSEVQAVNIPRSDLSLSMWQVTSRIRQLSAEKKLTLLRDDVKVKMAAAKKAQQAAEEAYGLVSVRNEAVATAQATVDRRMARDLEVTKKREAARVRRQAAKSVDGSREVQNMATSTVVEAATVLVAESEADAVAVTGQ